MLAGHVIITGASSGLGAALAVAYAAPGVTLSLAGRHAERLEKTADRCRSLGADVYTMCFDITDPDSAGQWIATAEAIRPIDLCIANAGLSGGTGGGSESLEQIRGIFDVNLYGVINTVTPIAETMCKRGQGQIAVVSSIAGFRGSLAAPAYSASKAAVIAYGQGLHGFLQPYRVDVSIICPGFIKTPMTDVNPFPMPFMIDAAKAADIIKRRLAKRAYLIAFPWQTALIARVMSILPHQIVDALLRRVPAKPPSE